MIVGIDFSIKSCAITVIDAGRPHFYTYARKSVAKEEYFQLLEACEVNVHRINDELPLHKNATLTERERSSTQDGITLSKSIAMSLSDWDFTYNCNAAFEGFSFGSTGNRLSQISGYQWIVRRDLLRGLGLPLDNMWFFSPMTIKATAGKGNFKKEQMIEAFLEEDMDHFLHQRMRTTPEDFQTKKGLWLKPIDDIVDSYWVAKTLEKTISNS